MTDLDIAHDIDAFERLVAANVGDQRAPWVVMHCGMLQASFSTFQAAVDYAVANLPKDEFFIGDIHETQVQVPLVVLYH
jgi:hypothetical protein